MTYYNEQLQALREKVARKAHLDAVLKDLQNQKWELDEKVKELKLAKKDEQKDVDRLEGRSLAAFFYAVIGKKEEKLDREREEAYAAAVKYDAALCELEAVKEDLDRYDSEYRTLRDCEAQYEKLLKEKTDALKESGAPEADEILQLEAQISCLESRIKEIKEAISAGKGAKSTANAVVSALEDAEAWGIWDLAGGGIFSGLIKHSTLDDAQVLVERLQVRLRRFKTELSDVTAGADMQVNIDGFLRFADHFFDGLLADWAVQDRIKESQARVKSTRKQIEDVLSNLADMLSDWEGQYTQLKEKADELIIKTEL